MAYTLISSRSAFRISLLVALLTIVSVFLWGLGHHATFFENSMLSTTILSIAFFLFITVSLYRGVKLKDDAAKTIHGSIPFDIALDPTTSASYDDGGPSVDADGLGGFLLSILLWIVWAIVVAVAVWLFANVIVVVIAVFAAMLYWIFFRATRLVLMKSLKTKGKIGMSVMYGVTYTILYNFWIYGIFILIDYLKG